METKQKKEAAKLGNVVKKPNEEKKEDGLIDKRWS